MNNSPKGNTLLVILLIVISFFAGYLFFKTKALEQKKTTINEQPSQTGMSYDKLPAVSDKDHILGKKDAQIVLIEYSDLECPFCKTFHTTMEKLMQDYDDKMAWVYRHYPLSFHQNAQKEAEAAECAAELGGNQVFWKYIDAIYEQTTSNGTGFALEKLVPLAQEVGLDQTEFKQCLDSGKYAQKVIDEMNQGAAAGVQGTPGTFIVTKNGQQDFINGALPYEQVKTQVDVLLGK